MTLRDQLFDANSAPTKADDRVRLASLESGTAGDWQAQYSLSNPHMIGAVRAALSGPPGKALPVVSTDILSTLHDESRQADPCQRTVSWQFQPGQEPKAMELVKDKDPVLYQQIKGKVKNPTYIGQTGDITEAVHDRKGHTIGCTYIQNAPYWLDGDAARSYLKVNADLSAKHKQIEVDHLNGAGRTFGQEEAIAWRNTGLHAKPGKSNHGFGRAIDLQDDDNARVQPSDDRDIREALHANGFRQGDSHGPLKNDLHHWSYTGPGRASEGHSIPPAHHRKHRR